MSQNSLSTTDLAEGANAEADPTKAAMITAAVFMVMDVDYFYHGECWVFVMEKGGCKWMTSERDIKFVSTVCIR